MKLDTVVRASNKICPELKGPIRVRSHWLREPAARENPGQHKTKPDKIRIQAVNHIELESMEQPSDIKIEDQKFKILSLALRIGHTPVTGALASGSRDTPASRHRRQ
jgi:hypothetical protein